MTQERIGCAVEMHGAGAALREAATEMRIVEADVVTKSVEQRHVGIGFDRMVAAVHIDREFLSHEDFLGWMEQYRPGTTARCRRSESRPYNSPADLR